MNNHLAVLMRVLNSVYDWFNLGVQLNVPRHSLKKIEMTYPKELERCKNEMLAAWLEGGNSEERNKDFLESALRNSGHNATSGLQVSILSALIQH